MAEIKGAKQNGSFKAWGSHPKLQIDKLGSLVGNTGDSNINLSCVCLCVCLFVCVLRFCHKCDIPQYISQMKLVLHETFSICQNWSPEFINHV